MADIRINLNYHRHPKIRKLKNRLGLEGVVSHQELLCYTAEYRSKGILYDMSTEDICLSSYWEGDVEEFINTLVELKLLDMRSSGIYEIHDWEEHNGWAFHKEERTAKAKKAAQARWSAKDDIKQCPKHGLELPIDDYSNAPTPNPIPSPNPKPLVIIEKFDLWVKNNKTKIDMIGKALAGYNYEKDSKIDLIVWDEIKNMRAWILGNPEKSKGRRIWSSFVQRWLKKTIHNFQNNGNVLSKKEENEYYKNKRKVIDYNELMNKNPNIKKIWMKMPIPRPSCEEILRKHGLI